MMQFSLNPQAVFQDRAEAGRLLAQKLGKYRNQPGVLLAVPRGGVPVAYEVAKELGLPMELVYTRKIGHPLNKEYAIGAASLTDYFIIPHENVTTDYIEKELLQIRKRLKEMQAKFTGDREPENLEGKTLIVVDDGVATGNTLLATLQVLRQRKPARIVVAAPVMPPSAMEKLQPAADEIVTLLVPETFYGVGSFYDEFEQVTDEDVIRYLRLMGKLSRVV